MKGNDTRGSMPFAIIAVTILIAAVFAGAAAASYERAADNADGTEEGIDAIDEAADDITTYIDRGLGEIVSYISTDPDLGGLEEREQTFQERVARWMELQFPMVSGGVRATCEGYDIKLMSVAMGISADGDLDGYVPAYLKGSGTVSVHLTSQSGKADADLEVYTDGSYSLPLAVERSELFESMAGDGGVTLSEMLSYQLTALAEYRVLNGYGAEAAYGSLGTDAILTEEDVLEAYELCVRAIAAVCFRDGDLAGMDEADLADMLIAEDGAITIDLAAVYAQALASAVDDLVLQWMDYLYVYEIADAVLNALDPLRGMRALIDFLSGEEKVSGVPYLISAMASFGYSEEDYSNPGAGTTTVTVGGLTVTVENPTADLLSQSWLKDFKKRYDSDGSFVEKYLREILASAALAVAGDSGLGTVSATVDPGDPESFAETLTSLFESCMSEGADSVGSAISGALAGAAVYDEFYGSLADEIYSHLSDLTLEDELAGRIRAALLEAAEAAAAEDPGYEVPDIDALMGSDEVGLALWGYARAVYDDVSLFRSLKTVEAEDGGFIKKVLTGLCSYGLRALDLLYPVEERAGLMIAEMAAIIGTNPYGGTVGLPGTTSFEVVDESGNAMTERLSADIDVRDSAATVVIDRDRCVHTVGFREDLSAAYSATMVVSVSGLIEYEVTGTGALADAMGSVTSSYRGSFLVDATAEVTVATGWALAGIEYEASNTVLTDLWNALLDVLEPIIEPLREVLTMLRTAAAQLAEALLEKVGFASQKLAELYYALMDPLEALKELVEDVFETAVEEALFNVLVSIDLGSQEVSFEFFGCTLTLKTSAISWAKTTKTILSVDMSVPVNGLTVTAGAAVKIRGEVKASNVVTTWSGGISGDDWKVSAKVDPLLKTRKYLFSIDGTVGDTDFSIIAPKLDQYYEMGLALSDVPGIGQVIDNIPLPVLGVNVGLDAGFSLRYSAPIENTLIINEFESNPAGEDSGNEWVEILNNGETTIDLEGYELVAASDKTSKRMTLSGELSPGEFLVVYPDFTLVNSSGRQTRSGEGLKLYDADGNLVDETPVKADSSNDGNTWQRKFDGSTEWVFTSGTEGKSNEGSWIGEIISPAEMKDCVWEAVEKAFGKVGSITDLDSLVSFVQYLVTYTIDEVIGVVSGQILDASVYASVDLKDVSGSVSGGVRVALRTDGDLIEDCLKYLAGQLEVAVLGISNPYRIDPLEMFTENIDLEVSVHAGIGFPKILSKGADLPEMDLAVVFRASLSAITSVIGVDTGDPVVEMGVMARDCPKAAIPSKLSPKADMQYDLWLLKVTLEFG